MRPLLTLAFAASIMAPQIAAAAPAAMSVSSPAFPANGGIPLQYKTISPPLAWSPVGGARSYAVTMQDPDAPIGRPFVHWLAWNIPGSANGLPEGGLFGVAFGTNDAGSVGYFGPHPPFGTHHYRIKVYALDTEFQLPPSTELPALTDAMRGHVLAVGELDGIFPPKGH